MSPKRSPQAPERTAALLDQITSQLRDYQPEELITLIRDFLQGLPAQEQARFLKRIEQGLPPVIAESLGLANAGDLLDAIETLRDDIASDAYVTEGAGFDPEYGEYRGFGDDSWIAEMDRLFAATTSLFHAGQFEAAADAYQALFRIFDLGEGGFHFTRPNPAKALHTDLDAMKRNVFVAIGQTSDNAAARAINLSDKLHYYGEDPNALLTAWESQTAWLEALEGALIEQAKTLPPPRQTGWLFAHPEALLREYYRRYRTQAELERLCGRLGAPRGWPYQDVVQGYAEKQDWPQALHWAEAGLNSLTSESPYRPVLQQVLGEAQLRLGRTADAFDTLRGLFETERALPVYLKLRQAALDIGRWHEVYPPLVAGVRDYVMRCARRSSYTMADVQASGLLGLIYLVEGDWQSALEWALDPKALSGWGDDDLPRIVAAGLLRLGLAASGQSADAVLSSQLQQAPALIRDQASLLDKAGQPLPGGPVLEGAVRVYEHLAQRGIDEKNRVGYTAAAECCAMIRSVRRLQGRAGEFESYYRGLHATYVRYSALRDELRRAIERTT